MASKEKMEKLTGLKIGDWVYGDDGATVTGVVNSMHDMWGDAEDAHGVLLSIIDPENPERFYRIKGDYVRKLKNSEPRKWKIDNPIFDGIKFSAHVALDKE